MAPRARNRKRPAVHKAFRDHSKHRKPGDLHTIPSFCQSNPISESTYFALKRRGLQPREMEVDGTIRITEQAEADWRAEREIATAAKRQRQRERSEAAAATSPA